jgi:hypothetical protein
MDTDLRRRTVCFFGAVSLFNSKGVEKSQKFKKFFLSNPKRSLEQQLVDHNFYSKLPFSICFDKAGQVFLFIIEFADAL